MKNLLKEIQSIQITDELIALNKKYINLGELCDNYDFLIESIRLSLNIAEWEDNSDTRTLTKMRDKIGKQMTKISSDLQKEMFLNKMIKGSMMIKALNEVERKSNRIKKAA